ncbi:MAG: pilus assembly protein PilP [Myxococcales bacterium]|nr:MAG: pilus assembly protein PilP [Myxococcales bacterium]
MSSRLLLALLALTALSGCGDEPAKPTAIPPPPPGAAFPAPAPGVAATPVAPADTQPPPKLEIVEAEFNESERSRDPFRSFAETFREETKGAAKSQREVVLSKFAIDELRLIGIVTRAEPAKAMLVDPGGTGYVVQRGQFVGKADVVQAAGRTGASYEINWRVDRIRDGDIVLIREDPQNPDVPSATRVIPLRPEGTDVAGK